jgi:hypothetical protein
MLRAHHILHVNRIMVKCYLPCGWYLAPFHYCRLNFGKDGGPTLQPPWQFVAEISHILYRLSARCLPCLLFHLIILGTQKHRP